MQTNSLILGFGTSRFIIKGSLDGITQEESLRQPEKEGNCVNWIAGHTLTTREQLLTMLGAGTFLSSEEGIPYQRGAQPLRPGHPCVSIDRLREGLEETSATLLTSLESMREETLEAAMDPNMFPIPVEKPTIGTMLNLLLFHETYHTGQLGLGRRLIGKPGLPL